MYNVYLITSMFALFMNLTNVRNKVFKLFITVTTHFLKKRRKKFEKDLFIFFSIKKEKIIGKYNL